MKLLLVLSLVALGAADVSDTADGYNYEQPSRYGMSGSRGVPFDGPPIIGLGGEFGAASTLDSSFSGSGRSDNFGGFEQGAGSGFDEQSAPVTITKNFYTVTAHDDGEDDDDDIGPVGVRKNYDVVFAHAPSPSLKSALKALNRFAGEHQTAVYVLSQKLSTAELRKALRASKVQINKPQVHFIKYKTPEEAELAQRQISAKYKALGGTNHYENAGSVPVQSVIGSSGHRRGGHATDGGPGFNGFRGSRTGLGSTTSGVGGPSYSNRYLPPRF